MSTPDVSADALRFVQDALARYVPDREVRVIGSRARGPAKPFSDLDLVVMGEDPLDLLTRARLRDAFDESDLPFVVDIVEWATSSGAFRQIITRTGVPLR